MEIPMDVIKQVLISLRKEANMSSYDPDDTPLPNLPSVEETLAELDPSPPYLRCKHCKGRLLRGVQTLTCVFCGRELCKDLPPDPVNFRDTFGYRWLLQSLSLSGSEIVDLPIGANELNRGQTARKDELSLSDLLNLEIKWTSRPEKIETDLSNENPNLPKLPDLAGVNLDNFFFEGNKDRASGSSEGLFGSNTQIVSKESFQVHETLSLFQNVKPFETVVQTTEGEGGDSGWAASFQFAASESLPQASGDLPQASDTLPRASENLPQASETLPQASETLPQASETLPRASENLPLASENLPQASETLPQASETLPQAPEIFPQESKSLDPFVGSTVDLSAHIDTVFGSVVDSTNEKSNHSLTGSTSMSTDWFQDDLLGVSNSGFSGGPEQLETLAEVKVGVQDNQLQTTSSKASDNKTTDKDDDSFDAWNDFASSSSAPNLVDGSVKQNGVDWVQDNQLQTTSSKAPDNKTTDEDDDSFDAWNDFASSSNAPKVVDSSVKQSGVDWVQDNQLQTTVNKAADNKTTDADDDSFDAWNDFTGSNNASNLADSSVQQSNNQTTPVDHTSEINLFGAASNSGDLDFGSFLQPDFSAGAFNSSSGSTVVDGAQSEPSVLDRLADASTNNGQKSEDVAEGGDVSSARAGSKSDDVERIMSQMHDLSFMLESTLSMPPKQDELHPPSKD
ncbi:hypothetical protein D8674_035900 [Pyrus ussuriensis x Pyrus communis]|uniref:DUF7815 domain-containing protein n=1 Tax=Pyrus ussuriensis x Pyrus communis TaxID=2448454 RepID=A0A5N5GS56_9ROSA|nr:hypothetical protein D8674_035900 [Pyrus ussuriensis x Pyrus communis]